MFTKLFDRRIHLFILVWFVSVAVGVTFGLHALWPANSERGYEPVQPIAFSHALHAGSGMLPDGRFGLQIDCRYCHSNVDTGAAASVPPVSTCMGCHSQVQTKVLPRHGDDRLETHAHDQESWWQHAKLGTYGTKESRDDAHAGHDHSGHGHGDDAHHGGHDDHSDEPVLHVDLAKLLWHWENEVPIRWAKVHDLADFVYFDHSRHMAAGLDCTDCHGPIEQMDRVRRVSGMKMGWCLDCHRQEPTEVTTDQYQAAGLRGPVHCSACHR